MSCLYFAANGVFALRLQPASVKLLHLRLLKLVEPALWIEHAVGEVMDVDDRVGHVDRGVLPSALTAHSITFEIKHPTQLCKVITFGQVPVPSCLRSKSWWSLQALLFDPERR